MQSRLVPSQHADGCANPLWDLPNLFKHSLVRRGCSEKMPSFEWGHELSRLPGRRLDLRCLTQQDAAAIFEIFGDPEVMRFWGTPPLRNLDAATQLIEEIHQFFRSRQLFQWGICSRETNEVFGTCTLLNVDLAHRRAEVGFALGRSAWGRGLATEALELLINFSFDALDLHRLEADVDPENDRSLRLLERQGFRREGYLRERWHHLGEVRDTVLLGLLRREWSRVGAVEPGSAADGASPRR